MKRKVRIDRLMIFLLAVLITSAFCFWGLTKVFKTVKKITGVDMFLAATTSEVPLYDENATEVKTLNRGTKVEVKGNPVSIQEKEYYKIQYDKIDYYVLVENVTKEMKDVVVEKEVYVRTPSTFYGQEDSLDIIGFITKGSKLEVLGYTNLKDGKVEKYKVKYQEKEGYIYSKYTVLTEQDALANYDEDGNYQIHASRLNNLRGGSGANLDYYPYEKANFENNKMPEEVRALYMNAGVVKNVDSYITLAKQSGINAIVVDIKDNTNPGYPAKAMEQYSKTNYEKALNSYEEYKKAITKIKEAGLYAIGRITVFKDSYYAKDHPEDTIKQTSTGTPYNHDGSYWPSAYKRNVWQFNVALAIESVLEMGFNEIQFDYVRFPDRVGDLEKNGIIDFGNTYNEEKAQAIQEFVMYACDEIHKVGAYVSVDVFGEAAHNYVTAYGQYWPAISNIVDVISGMPYPDHFNKNEYGLGSVVWTIPYRLLKFWGENYVMKRQAEIPTPAIVRTWIQAYNTSKSPATVYDSYMVSEEIKGLYDAGLTGGFMTWNGSSSLDKYQEISPAFGKEYK